MLFKIFGILIMAMTLHLQSEEETPQLLYKIISFENWKASHGKKYVQLSPDDQEFIHLAKEDQIARITNKYWSREKGYVVLSVDPEKLEGSLVYEANPGGLTKYYHLYNGKIPLEAITDVKVVGEAKQPEIE